MPVQPDRPWAAAAAGFVYRRWHLTFCLVCLSALLHVIFLRDKFDYLPNFSLTNMATDNTSGESPGNPGASCRTCYLGQERCWAGLCKDLLKARKEANDYFDSQVLMRVQHRLPMDNGTLYGELQSLKADTLYRFRSQIGIKDVTGHFWDDLEVDMGKTILSLLELNQIVAKEDNEEDGHGGTLKRDSDCENKENAPIQQSSSGDEVLEVTEGGKNMRTGTQTEEPKLPAEPWLGLYHGDVIKRMISDTLKKWCEQEAKPKIFIVTPFIDKDGLRMIKDAIGSHKIETLYTRAEHDDKPLKHVMKGILAKKDVVKLRVANNDKELPTTERLYFHCKFVAAEFSNRVEILMTSANLLSGHFMDRQIDSVHVYQEKPKEFEENYLKKLDGHTYEYDWTSHCGSNAQPTGRDGRYQGRRRLTPPEPLQGGSITGGQDHIFIPNMLRNPRTDNREAQRWQRPRRQQRGTAHGRPPMGTPCTGWQQPPMDFQRQFSRSRSPVRGYDNRYHYTDGFPEAQFEPRPWFQTRYDEDYYREAGWRDRDDYAGYYHRDDYAGYYHRDDYAGYHY
ncbi:Hypp4689 [Branchiostoma lanceolatum]|uniref:Hypp4689 protein n=1 Tax=Branchiostoma lanceolatum TaxID=7740 RepID=A0A8K0EYX3_BRALA|nr:Hypp4689 [Branchiostoma lanceolatum]